MTSLAFPKMLSGSSTNVITGKEAILSDLKLLLLSRKKELFGDPEFGTRLHNIIFEQQSYLLVDIIKDEIYTEILKYMPQLTVTRENIQLSATSKQGITVTITGTNNINGSVDLYTIDLIDSGEV